MVLDVTCRGEEGRAGDNKLGEEQITAVVVATAAAAKRASVLLLQEEAEEGRQ